MTRRAKDYAAKVLTLTAYIAETQELLDLERRHQERDGGVFSGVDEAKVTGAGEDSADSKVELDAVAAANAGAGAVTAKGGKGARSVRHPVRLTGCDEVKGPKADDPKGKGKGGKAPKKK